MLGNYEPPVECIFFVSKHRGEMANENFAQNRFPNLSLYSERRWPEKATLFALCATLNCHIVFPLSVLDTSVLYHYSKKIEDILQDYLHHRFR
jgi:hypothetical protein